MLPEDILLEILYRLPVESLLRFRCVCKTWRHIIATPEFAKSHLACQKASPSTNKSYILYYDENLCTLFSDSDPLFDSTKHSKLCYMPELLGRHVPSDQDRNLEIHGACNGLLCLSDDHGFYCIGNDIHLWNPMCRKAKKLPQLDISIKGKYGLTLHAGVIFGYHGDDYKVIVIAPVDNIFIVSVYSLSTNSWNITQTNSNLEVDNYSVCVVATKFVDGTAYMMTRSMMTPMQPVICYYNLSNETIRVIKLKLPEECCAVGFALEAYGDTIAVLGHEKNCLTMWILRDKSSSSSWEKKFSIDLHQVYPLYQAVGFLSNGQYLLRTLLNSDDLDSCVTTKLFLCDLETQELTQFRTLTDLKSRYGHPPKYPDLEGRITSDFVESLLLLNEDSVHPFVQMEIDSFCSSILFTLQWDTDE